VIGQLFAREALVAIGLVGLMGCTASDGGRCSDSLSNLNPTYGGTCPGTHARAVAPAFTCGLYGAPVVFAGSCGGLAAVAYSYGNTWKLCVYDGVDAGTLIGAGAESDIDSFCNQTAYTVTGGQVPIRA
jgi:hypothetical protein